DHQRYGLDAGAAESHAAAAGERGVRPLSPDDRAGGAEIDAMYPGQGQSLYVRGVDLFERAVVPAGVIAMVGRPCVGRRLEQQRWIERPLRKNGAGRQKQNETGG